MSVDVYPYGWRATVVEEPGDLAARVHLWRPVGDEVEHVIGWGVDGHPVTRRVAADVQADHRGFAFAPEMLAALVEAVDATPARREVARLEDALAVERRRVDGLLAAVADVARGRAETGMMTATAGRYPA